MTSQFLQQGIFGSVGAGHLLCSTVLLGEVKRKFFLKRFGVLCIDCKRRGWERRTLASGAYLDYFIMSWGSRNWDPLNSSCSACLTTFLCTLSRGMFQFAVTSVGIWGRIRTASYETSWDWGDAEWVPESVWFSPVNTFWLWSWITLDQILLTVLCDCRKNYSTSLNFNPFIC